MELPEREEWLVANGINRDCPPTQWRSAVVASLAATRGRPGEPQREGETKAAYEENVQRPTP